MKNGQNYDLLLSTLDKAENGPMIDEKEWDRAVIGKASREILEKYDIDLKRPADGWRIAKIFAFPLAFLLLMVPLPLLLT